MPVHERYFNEGAEGMFKYLCDFHFWNFRKIPEENFRTPDFKVKTSKGRFICEVKELDSIGYKIGKAFGFTVGDKVRASISSAKGQLKNYDLPTLLMLYDKKRTGVCGYESIVSAMYGALTVKINKNTGQTGEFYYGKNSQTQKNKNTSISAIADLSFSKQGKSIIPIFSVYHNMYAKNPFEKGFFNGIDNVYEYIFEESESV